MCMLIMLVLLGKNENFMYKNVLLTDKEICLLKSLISQTLNEKLRVDRNNLTIILNRLRDIKSSKKYNQSIN